MSNAVKRGWETVFRRHFCPNTELLYEFTVDNESNAWHHLPTTEDIRANSPNPCGWGTGMEDSVLNGASALDTVLSAYEITGDRSLKSLADPLFRGLLRCETDGFIARSVSPVDGKTHYIESSRDQFTHWIYGALRLYGSALCDEDQKTEIRRALVAIAKRCEREVTEENGWNLLREDGSVGKVCKMWGEVDVHEWFRLPMFYLAAYHVSGDFHWKDLYMNYRDTALEHSSGPLPEYRAYCYLQMQYSLRAVYACDEDPDFRAKLLPLMEKLAERGEETARRESQKFRDAKYKDALNYRFRPWNEIEPLHQGIFGGYNYENPAQSERKENFAFYPARNVGEGALLAALCPCRRISKDLLSAVEELANTIDYQRHSNLYAPLLLACGYVACKENLLIIPE